MSSFPLRRLKGKASLQLGPEERQARRWEVSIGDFELGGSQDTKERLGEGGSYENLSQMRKHAEQCGRS